jgi:wobble nucleotide-excising tRNase
MQGDHASIIQERDAALDRAAKFHGALKMANATVDRRNLRIVELEQQLADQRVMLQGQINEERRHHDLWCGAEARIAEMERVQNDLAMIVRMLLSALSKRAPGLSVITRAWKHLTDHGLEGSLLREETNDDDGLDLGDPGTRSCKCDQTNGSCACRRRA